MLKARLAKIHNDSSLTDIQVTSPPSSPLEKRVSVVKNTVKIGRKYDMSSLMRKSTMWFLNRSDTNQAVRAQMMVRGWKFWIKIAEELYYLCSKN